MHVKFDIRISVMIRVRVYGIRGGMEYAEWVGVLFKEGQGIVLRARGLHESFSRVRVDVSLS